MSRNLEIWGGVECTVNRVGDIYFDQLSFSGHDMRLEDLERFAALGLRTLRYPVIWERIAPDHPNEFDWKWTDERLIRARELGIRVIAGLVHHGSGPKYTDLLDPLFPEKLASFAERVAARYPWLDADTPINEPLTTARFSGLYGHWYPHARSHRAFVRMLFAECHGTALAMQAIRRITPEVMLVQTEDMGRIFSTPFMAYEASYENARRWLSLDMLTGQLTPDHELWNYCQTMGLTESELQTFIQSPCPPDIVGINHYVTSNRFLDERQERYPVCYHGGNERHRFADIEAVLVGAENIVGPREVLRQAWDRYKLPLAITETHIGSSRDEQLRWIDEFWRTALDLQDEGIDMRAVAIWALLGSYDWNCLVTQRKGCYESGVFDMRAGQPRPTALAGFVKALAHDEPYDHPVLDMPGWWHRPDRLRFAPVKLRDIGIATKVLQASSRTSRPREVIITGSPGPLATAFAYVCQRRGLPYRLFSRKNFDISDQKAVHMVLKEIQPWAVINAAGYSRIDDAEVNIQACQRDNVIGPSVLAAVCAEHNIPLLTFSSHLVFDGKQKNPYTETSSPAPLNVYGQSKVEAEKIVLSQWEGSLVIRAGDFFGPWDETNLLTLNLRKIFQGVDVTTASDVMVSPTYLPDLVDSSLDLLIDGETGLWHLANSGVTSWAAFTSLAAEACNLNLDHIVTVPASEIRFAATRPSFSALCSERARLLPSLENAIERYAREGRAAFGQHYFDPGASA
ncbi:MAG TPA: family 1 glycosylhydrolase [Oligoflexus sp.]|uniref:family 1 glycosylhydrolase n=1 Tax=Oligoflexus sp. TaxID=1971216 RepID=UPI002D3749B6|nr:family 1 glycosylhydrolase [Oligoflexus sp.]HYX39337.1 family 1 glycosylhydrolase [Oligoflexus sp.]